VTTAAFTELLEEARRTHDKTAALRRFCPFPTDLRPATWTPYLTRGASLFASQQNWGEQSLHPLARAFQTAGPEAQWRETYRAAEIGEDFFHRFGCYCLIGQGAPWISDSMRAFVVYLPPGLWYPWHRHPAEELYYVLAGEGEFFCDGQAAKTLRTGQTSFHSHNQPHALRTHDRPLLAYVLWRNHLTTAPVLTQAGGVNSACSAPVALGSGSFV
jgi:mannose-6-phosphate isomerase-like protein (cupin superfamily)